MAWLESFIREHPRIVVTIVLFIVGAAITIYGINRGMPVRDMRAVILSSGQLINVDPVVKSDVGFTYKGDVIKNLGAVEFRLEYRGNRPIAESDYSQPITVTFTTKTEAP